MKNYLDIITSVDTLREANIKAIRPNLPAKIADAMKIEDLTEEEKDFLASGGWSSDLDSWTKEDARKYYSKHFEEL
ncbi:MAG: hypothetical protein LBM13_06655, partial [Candidatus Ancillula sp.]|nr:hypothetical protein [Candidatus Ancillula sp.]